MSTVRKRIWTARRKLMGNLIPSLIWAPLTIYGLYLIRKTGVIFGPGFWFILAAQVLGLVAVNFFGLYDNQRMKQHMMREAEVLYPHLRGWMMFVGYAPDGYGNLLDPHKDVGILILTPDSIEFVGDSHLISLRRSQVLRVTYRANIHSLVGLGRWVTIEGRKDGKLFVLHFEPREAKTLLGDRRLSSNLKQKLENWLIRSGPPV
ncbi:MAG: hypothetical protein JSS72_12980 [Armatimonadetes bacterium]|nr:hypothetical protein [Armatimonadota bacterium]